MTHEIDESCGGCGSVRTTRRALLQAAVGGAGALSLLSLSAGGAKAAKISQAAAGYVASPNGDHVCAKCNMFLAPNSCKQVDGVINPAAHCKIGVWAS
jgi:hypothetical protein